ncbi:hypothetical protein WMY93_015200 [Mugilogobius chulae]|uniref:Uncharacterized protein n=1 Tax=Mugilogobius chulae TaxID=88201 RepID=A0AAW0NWT0_9GOBI
MVGLHKARDCLHPEDGHSWDLCTSLLTRLQRQRSKIQTVHLQLTPLLILLHSNGISEIPQDEDSTCPPRVSVEVLRASALLQDGGRDLVPVDSGVAAHPPVHRLAPEHAPGGSVRPHQPPDHLPGPGPALRRAAAGGQHRTHLCPEHEAREAPLLSHNKDMR